MRKTGQPQRPSTIPSSQCPISQSHTRLLKFICSGEIQVFPFLPYPTVMEKSVPCSPPCADFTASLPNGQVSLPEAGTSQGRGQGSNPARAASRLQAPRLSLPSTCPGQAGRHRSWRHHAQSEGCACLKRLGTPGLKRVLDITWNAQK